MENNRQPQKKSSLLSGLSAGVTALTAAATAAARRVSTVNSSQGAVVSEVKASPEKKAESPTAFLRQVPAFEQLNKLFPLIEAHVRVARDLVLNHPDTEDFKQAFHLTESNEKLSGSQSKEEDISKELAVFSKDYFSKKTTEIFQICALEDASLFGLLPNFCQILEDILSLRQSMHSWIQEQTEDDQDTLTVNATALEGLNQAIETLLVRTGARISIALSAIEEAKKIKAKREEIFPEILSPLEEYRPHKHLAKNAIDAVVASLSASINEIEAEIADLDQHPMKHIDNEIARLRTNNDELGNKLVDLHHKIEEKDKEIDELQKDIAEHGDPEHKKEARITIEGVSLKTYQEEVMRLNAQTQNNGHEIQILNLEKRLEELNLKKNMPEWQENEKITQIHKEEEGLIDSINNLSGNKMRMNYLDEVASSKTTEGENLRKKLKEYQEELQSREREQLDKEAMTLADHHKAQTLEKATQTKAKFLSVVLDFLKQSTLTATNLDNVWPSEILYPVSDFVWASDVLPYQEVNEYKSLLREAAGDKLVLCNPMLHDEEKVFYQTVLSNSLTRVVIHLAEASKQPSVDFTYLTAKKIDSILQACEALGIDSRIQQQLAFLIKKENTFEVEKEKVTRRASWFPITQSIEKAEANSGVSLKLTEDELLGFLILLSKKSGSESLQKILDQHVTAYDFKADSPLVNEFLSYVYLKLLAKGQEAELTVNNEEVTLFTHDEMLELTQHHWLTRLIYLSKRVEHEFPHLSHLEKLRIQSIFRIFINLAYYQADIDQWVDDFSALSHDQLVGDACSKLNKFHKKKLVFSLIASVVYYTLIKVNSHLAIYLKENLDSDGLIIEGDQNDILKLGVYFLSLHPSLMQGTNFKTSYDDKTQKIVLKDKPKDGVRAIKSAMSSVTKIKFKKEKEKVEVTETIELPLVEDKVDHILLTVSEEKGKEAIHILFSSLIDNVEKSIDDAREFFLGNYFLSVIKMNLDDEDEYLTEYHKHKKNENTHQEIITPSGFDKTPLRDIVAIARSLNNVLGEFVFSDTDQRKSLITQDHAAAIFSVDMRRGIGEWIELVKSNINLVKNIGHDSLRGLLMTFQGVLTSILLLSQDNQSLIFLMSQSKTTQAAFYSALEDFLEAVSLCYTITLSLDQEKFLTERNQALLNNQISVKDRLMELKNSQTWDDHDAIVSFFTQRVQNHLNQRKLPDGQSAHELTMSVFLPKINAALMSSLVTQYGKSFSDASKEILSQFMNFERQSVKVSFTIVDKHLVMTMQTNPSSLYALQIRPRYLNPNHPLTDYPLDESERSFLSLLKPSDAYVKEKQKPANLKSPSEDTGATSRQLAEAAKRMPEYSFAWIGMVAFLYIYRIQATFLKIENQSDYARMLRWFAKNYAGLDLADFRRIFEDYIRGLAYNSSVAVKELPEHLKAEKLVVRLSLTMMFASLVDEGILTNHQIQFIIRANQYLEVLHLSKIIENLGIYKLVEDRKRIDGLLMPIIFIQQSFGDLTTKIDDFFKQSRSTLIQSLADTFNSLQKQTLPCLLALRLCAEWFLALQSMNDSQAKAYAQMNKLLLHTLRKFMPNNAFDDFLLILALDFYARHGVIPSREANAFEADDYVILAPSASTEVKSQNIADGSRLAVYSAGRIAIVPSENQAERTAFYAQAQGVGLFQHAPLPPQTPEDELLLTVLSK